MVKLAARWTALGILALSVTAQAEDWPQWRGSARDGVWKESGLLERFAGPELPLKWKVPLGAGYSGPTVAKGRVYVTDRVTEPRQQERVHCFDSKTGKTVWSFSYDCVYGGIGYQAGPRAAVTVHDGRAYALGAVGHLHCFDAASGKLLWAKDLNSQYRIRMPIWGISPAPLVEDNLVILHIGGSDGSCLVALDRLSGEERWKALDDRGSYSPPILINQGGKRVMVCWTGDRVIGADPKTGTLYWEQPFAPTKMVISIATPVLEGERLFLTNFYDGALMLRVPKDRPIAEKLWQRRGPSELNTDALHSIISTPMMVGDYIYGVDSYGELRCLKADTGDRVWQSDQAVPRARWSTIHFVQNQGKVWMFNERGELIIATLSPEGYKEISRTRVIKPTLAQLQQRGGVCWSHPAFADRHIFARNDEELVCASLEGPR